MTPRRSAALALGALIAAAVFPAASAAHGVAAKADLPIPAWMFAWAATLVLVVSFAGLAVLWREPLLANSGGRDLLSVGPWVDLVLGGVGICFFAVVCWAGLTGTFVATANIAPTGVWVAFWVGIPILSALFGDVFRLLSPWRATARGVGWIAGRLSRAGLPQPHAWPERLGCRPAVVGLVAMVWLELAFLGRDEPATLAVLALAYAAIQLVGMSIWGVEAWSRNGDSFGVAFSLIARVSPLEVVDRRLRLRVPLSGVARLPRVAGQQAVLVLIVGATSFDGFSAGPVWPDWSQWLAERGRNLGLGATVAAEVASTIGLLGSLLVVWAIWTAGTAGAASVLERDRGDVAASFVGVLIPIALAYTVAHYASLLLYQGQALGYLASDPAGTGADWLGTASWTIDYGVVGPTAIWWIQLVALVVGHVAALAVAHDRALEVSPDARAATRSQVPMLVATVAFTTLALWLLSAANL